MVAEVIDCISANQGPFGTSNGSSAELDFAGLECELFLSQKSAGVRSATKDMLHNFVLTNYRLR